MKKEISCLIIMMVIAINFTSCSAKVAIKNTATNGETNQIVGNGKYTSILEKIKAKLDKALTDQGNASKLTDEAFQLLVQYLKGSEGKGVTSDKIKEISEYIHINEWGDSRIIDYTQPPEIFGNSGKSSWQIFQDKTNNLVFIIERNVPLHLEYFRLIKVGTNLILYTYGIDFETQPNKVYIHAFGFDNNAFEKINVLKIDDSTGLWGCDEESGEIFSKKNYSVYIDALSEDGKEVTIKGVGTDQNAKKITLNLALGKDGLFYLKK